MEFVEGLIGCPRRARRLDAILGALEVDIVAMGSYKYCAVVAKRSQNIVR
jgi:hypothetical protein